MSSTYNSPTKGSIQMQSSVNESTHENENTGYTIPQIGGQQETLLNSLKTNYNDLHGDRRKAFLEQKFVSSPVHKSERFRKKQADTFSGI
jgi:hypothetical protein